ncbi:hypothetical protein QBC46DRAFT_116863 [Diplogelasinospora grovesii]|uniref:SRR1-like domain-containing protein n=1 Tax=Diplogelasinospora grovesii TaxID=303347 RepID=A0AAN6NH25_9PEZI|nr:hypothetical protein QBC46DRAFT_116863 [Diplogelasinospora grovesii]
MVWDWQGKNGERDRNTVHNTAILTIRDMLAKSKGLADPNTIKCYAQGPRYTDVDRQVLEDQGITVLDDPKAFLEIDEETVVLSICPEIPVRQIVADIARPAMMIWDKVQQWSAPEAYGLSYEGWTDDESTRLFNMVREYGEFEFAQDDPNFYCGNVGIYIRKPSSSLPSRIPVSTLLSNVT